MNPPKLFLSYGWSTPEHDERVITLANDLVASNVDVVLDKWELLEGHDKNTFMERMVNDPAIQKVAMLCDKVYAEKADGRAGGVGTETQIISQTVYENQSVGKFVAVVLEKDPEGKPYVPTYYKGRIYIDLSDSSRYAENFEKLLRWIYGKPLYTKPPLGKTPSYLLDSPSSRLGTSPTFSRCLDGIKSQRSYAAGALDDYLSVLSSELERLRIVKSEKPFDEAVVESIEEFTPHRNELVQIFHSIARYSSPGEHAERIHRFFESLIPYLDRPPSVSQWDIRDFDNFRFIVHELFLLQLAVQLKYERFGDATRLLDEGYFVPGNTDYGRNAMVDYRVFWKSARSFDDRNSRLGLHRLSLRADLLNERIAGTGLEFRHLMQADFVAFIRSELSGGDEFWFPESLVYVGRFGSSPFEIFARAESRKFFDRIKGLFSIGQVKDLEPLLEAYQNQSKPLPRWEMNRFNPVALLGFQKLGVRA